MNDEGLKKIVTRALTAVDECPEELKTKAFEMILKHLLTADSARVGVNDGPNTGASQDVAEAVGAPIGAGEDIQLNSIHIKARRFISDSNLTEQQLNQLFYLDEGEFKPLYDDLQSTKIAESQLRLTVLEALERALKTGDFEFDSESVREKCKMFKCYDGANFAANFNNNKEFFEGFEKYERGGLVRLSKKGKIYLAEIMLALVGS